MPTPSLLPRQPEDGLTGRRGQRSWCKRLGLLKGSVSQNSQNFGDRKCLPEAMTYVSLRRMGHYGWRHPAPCQLRHAKLLQEEANLTRCKHAWYGSTAAALFTTAVLVLTGIVSCQDTSSLRRESACAPLAEIIASNLVDGGRLDVNSPSPPNRAASRDCAWMTGHSECAGINRHVVGDGRALQERK